MATVVLTDHAWPDVSIERQIVESMAVRAPRLGAERIGRIMSAVIEAGLQVSEERDLSPA